MRTEEEKAGDARMAWLAILKILNVPDGDGTFEIAIDRLEMLGHGPTLKIAAVQFIIIGSGWSTDGYYASGSWDTLIDTPQLHKLFGAAGGDSFR